MLRPESVGVPLTTTCAHVHFYIPGPWTEIRSGRGTENDARPDDAEKGQRDDGGTGSRGSGHDCSDAIAREEIMVRSLCARRKKKKKKPPFAPTFNCPASSGVRDKVFGKRKTLQRDVHAVRTRFRSATKSAFGNA